MTKFLLHLNFLLLRMYLLFNAVFMRHNFLNPFNLSLHWLVSIFLKNIDLIMILWINRFGMNLLACESKIKIFLLVMHQHSNQFNSVMPNNPILFSFLLLLLYNWQHIFNSLRHNIIFRQFIWWLCCICSIRVYCFNFLLNFILLLRSDLFCIFFFL